MMRSVVILGCAALLAIGFSVVSFAGSVADADGDGIPDAYDNCQNTDNGPVASTGGCVYQEDYDGDGYGQPCDFDYNQNGAADSGDLGDLLVALGNAGSADPKFDNNCNGAPDSGDFGDLLVALGSNPVPGPSGLACAGVGPFPCVAP